MKTVCPECGAEFETPQDVVIGEILTCPECGLELEVTSIEKCNVEVKPSQVSGEDWGE
ncbi:MAG: lysine biosynthesis protein LysW [Candidatus Bathyarchaeota archaeon]